MSGEAGSMLGNRSCVLMITGESSKALSSLSCVGPQVVASMSGMIFGGAAKGLIILYREF